MRMEDNFVGNLFTKIKSKLNGKKNNYPQFSEYSFSGEEMDSISRQNLEEINKLRRGSVGKEKEKVVDVVSDIPLVNVLSSVNEEDVSGDKVDYDINDSIDEKIEIHNNSYIDLSSDRRENIMKRWNSIDVVKLTHDIYEGRDILDHNYVITYADKALEYIYKIRGEYDILIEYLIGFNNEKKGILNKNIFSDKLDNEWKYLKNYVKVLEKIRSAIDN